MWETSLATQASLWILLFERDILDTGIRWRCIVQLDPGVP